MKIAVLILLILIILSLLIVKRETEHDTENFTYETPQVQAMNESKRIYSGTSKTAFTARALHTEAILRSTAKPAPGWIDPVKTYNPGNLPQAPPKVIPPVAAYTKNPAPSKQAIQAPLPLPVNNPIVVNYHFISGLNTNKTLCMSSRGTKIGAPIILDECPKSNVFSFDNKSRIVAPLSQKCIEIPEGSNSVGVALTFNNCTDNSNQKWSVNKVTGAIYSQMNENLCVDVAGGNTELGTVIQTWNCMGNNAQKWEFEAGRRLRWVYAPQGVAKCVDVTDGVNNPGTPLTMWNCDYEYLGGYEGNQKFRFDGKGRIIWTTFEDKCLRVRDPGNPGNGNPIELAVCGEDDSQKFYQDGKLIKWKAHPNKCLDVAGGNPSDGTPLQIWDCVPDNINQHWVVGF